MRGRILPFVVLAVTAATISGCGGSGSGAGPAITVQAARTYHLAGFTPAQPVSANVPTRLSFTITQPNGKPLTAYRHGTGPHNGIHLIIVRRDLSVIIHRHPPVGADGEAERHGHLPCARPLPRRDRRLPQDAGAVPSFQLFQTIQVKGTYRPQPLPPPASERDRRRLPLRAARAPRACMPCRQR